jgi:3D (Asp-Asp-Asp) domain-containing protein
MGSASLLAATGLALALFVSAPSVGLAEVTLGESALVQGTGGTGVRVRSGPGQSYKILGSVPEGARVDVLDGPRSGEDQLWYQVSYLDGAGVQLRGWAVSTYLVAATPSTSATARTNGTRTFSAKVAGYASGGGIGFFTTTGTRVHWGTVAVDPSFVKLGSLLTIEGLEGTFTAEDTGSGVKGAMLDVWFPDLAAARAWGTRARQVTILREGY